MDDESAQRALERGGCGDLSVEVLDKMSLQIRGHDETSHEVTHDHLEHVPHCDYCLEYVSARVHVGFGDDSSVSSPSVLLARSPSQTSWILWVIFIAVIVGSVVLFVRC